MQAARAVPECIACRQAQRGSSAERKEAGRGEVENTTHSFPKKLKHPALGCLCALRLVVLGVG